LLQLIPGLCGQGLLADFVPELANGTDAGCLLVIPIKPFMD
jgi:hypothetical protein